MQDRSDILYKFLLVHNQYRCVEFHAESFKSAVSKTDKSVFMRDYYGFDFLIHNLIQ